MPASAKARELASTVWKSLDVTAIGRVVFRPSSSALVGSASSAGRGLAVPVDRFEPGVGLLVRAWRPGRPAGGRRAARASAARRPGRTAATRDRRPARCRCASTKPGISMRPPSSITFVSAPMRLAASASEPTKAMRPSRTATACAMRRWPSMVTTLPPRSTTSAGSNPSSSPQPPMTTASAIAAESSAPPVLLTLMVSPDFARHGRGRR